MAESARELHLSVVAVSRNDDHGGDLRGRMQHFVNGFVAQCRRHQLDAELILVEWNPPPGRPPLADALQWPDDPGPASVRIVTVPPEIHARFAHASQLPLFQMIGKNVGIRRARGRFVLATNVDILLDDATVRYLRDRLRSGKMLRVDRYDVPGNLRLDVPFDRILSQCAQSFFHVNVRFGVFDVCQRQILGLGMSPMARFIHLLTEMRILGLRRARPWRGLLSLALLPLRLYEGAKRITVSLAVQARLLLTTPARPIHRVGKLLSRLVRIASGLAGYVMGLLHRVGKWLSRLVRIASGLAGYVMGLLGPRSAASARYHRLRWLHTNACGDFTLLTRDDWARLRGYPEWPIYSWHLDSAFMYAASVHDVAEVALGAKYRIYHLDHSSGSGWSPGGAPLLFARLDAKGIAYLSDQDLERWRRQVAAEPPSAIVNDPTWGLGDQLLPERQVLPRLPKSLRQEVSR